MDMVRLGSSRTVRGAGDGDDYPDPPQDDGRQEHAAYLADLAAVTALMARLSDDKSAPLPQTAAGIARQLCRLSKHATRSACRLCRSDDGLAAEKRFLAGLRPYLASPHGRSAASLDRIRVDVPGMDEDETDDAYPFQDLSAALAAKRS